MAQRSRNRQDDEIIEGEQGLLLFAPNLQSFGMLPKSGTLEGTSSLPFDDQASYQGQQRFTAGRSEEDVQEDIGDDDDDIDKDQSLASIQNIADPNITKVSSTRKLNDQGGESFSPEVKDKKRYSRNETFAAGSRCYLSSNLSRESLGNRSQRQAEMLLQGVSFQLTKSEAVSILQSGLLVSVNAHSRLVTLCKDITSLLDKSANTETRQSIESLFQVLKWRVDNTITSFEFSQIFSEWKKANGRPDTLTMAQLQEHHESQESSAVSRQKFEDSLIELVQIGLKYSNRNLESFISDTPRMIELLKDEFNKQLQKESLIDDLWLQIVERLYAQLDFEQGHFAGCGSLGFDRMQFFLLSLLLNEITQANWSRISEIVMKQTQALMKNMHAVAGYVSLRDFKMYLLLEGVKSHTDIQVLFEHFEIVMKTYRRISKKKKEAKEESQGLARTLYQNMKKLVNSSTDSIQITSLIKKGNLPNCVAQSILQAFSFHSREALQTAVQGQASVFDFQSQSVDEELEGILSLWKYSLTRLLQIANERDLIHGTYLPKDAQMVNKLKTILITDYNNRETQVDQLQLIGFFTTLLQTYQVMNEETLTDMCKYLNMHIGQNQEQLDTEVFSVHNYRSNDKQNDPSGSKQHVPYSQSNSKLSGDHQDSRPSFGSSYVDNFIKEEELQRSQQKQTPEQMKNRMASVAMFGENYDDLTPQESTIKMEVQDESTLILQQMGLVDSDHNAYSTQPNGNPSDNQEEIIVEIKAPLTTKNGQVASIRNSEQTIAAKQVENFEEPSAYVQESRLPKFNIDLSELHQRNLEQITHDFTVGESTGMGHMLSKRQEEVPKLPKRAKGMAFVQIQAKNRTGSAIKVEENHSQQTPEHRQTSIVQKSNLTKVSNQISSQALITVLGQSPEQVQKMSHQQQPKQLQKIRDSNQMKSQKHLSNVQSVGDVLSNLSKSPKFNTKMINNDSIPILSIDSPNKFFNETGKEISGSQSNTGKRARSLLGHKQTSQQIDDTPSFSFQDQQSSRILSSYHLNHQSQTPTLQPQFSMQTNGTLQAKALKNTQNTQSMMPLSSSYLQQKGDLNITTKRSHSQLNARQHPSPKSALASLQQQRPLLTTNRSTFLSVYSGFNQKVKRSTSQNLQAHISKSSLRRIEPYEEVLKRLKVSVMQVLGKKGKGGRQLATERSTANPAQLSSFMDSWQTSGSAMGLTSKNGKGLLFTKSPSKQTTAAIQQSQYFVNGLYQGGLQTGSIQVEPKGLQSSLSVPNHYSSQQNIKSSRGARVTHYSMGGVNTSSPATNLRKQLIRGNSRSRSSKVRSRNTGGRRQINNLELNNR